MRLASKDFELAILSGKGLIGRNHVGIHSASPRHSESGLLCSFPGQPGTRERAVRVSSIPEVPEGILALGPELATEMGLIESQRTPWRLELDVPSIIHADEVCLELGAERPIDQVLSELENSSDLAEINIWVPPGSEPGSLWINVEGTSFRVRSIEPEPWVKGGIVEVSSDTRFELFSPSSKSGVDIVVLADCSGSMSWKDLPDDSDSTISGLFRVFTKRESQTISRMEALHRALRQLLGFRLQVSGRVSRMALVRFTTDCLVRFPKGGSMLELDGSSRTETVQGFREAVALLTPENAGTDIGQALFYAAQLLHNHGHPGNERLIVLVSDGATWKAKGEESSGEEVQAISDSVSLMEHLHREMRINIHAIGISNDEIFWPWWRRNNPGKEPHISAIPNHHLLERLVAVGGGDPSRVGGMDVLEKYFSGLGTGITRILKQPRRSEPRSLASIDLGTLRARADHLKIAQRTTTSADESEMLARRIKALFLDCNHAAEKCVGRPLFVPTTRTIETLEFVISRQVIDYEQFSVFIQRTQQVFWEQLDAKLRSSDIAYEIGPVAEYIANGRLRSINSLRIYEAHDLGGGQSNKDRRDNANQLRKIGALLKRLVGTEHIDRDDNEGWSQLHLAILRELQEILEELRERFRQAPSSPLEGESPLPKPGGFVYRE
jgi:hypothetical protein